MSATGPTETELRTHRLNGCRPEPLASYLKALGVLRLVAEQADPGAAGRWHRDVFELRAGLDGEELFAFFLDRYRPTPLVAPWNRGSGFHEGGSSPKAEQTLAVVESTDDSRLAPLREAIVAGRQVCQEARAAGWHEQRDKRRWVERARASLPESALAWLDVAAVVVGEDTAFPPLAGSGGVFGRLDISVTFIQRVLDVLAVREGRNAPDRDRSRTWLRGALLGEPVAGQEVSIGQFHPGASGGVGTNALDENRSVVNPWDVVLLFEGTLLFGAAAARRLSAERSRSAAMPFMVAASAVGYSTGADEESARGEVWAPLWQRPAGLAELRHLLAEGRAQWRGRQARNGLELAQAIASLGTDRGIAEFSRHAVVERFGQSDFAVPAGRFPARPKREVPLVERLDEWAARGRGLDHPASFVRARRRLDQALFALAARGGARNLQQVLVAAAGLEEVVGKGSSDLRERIPPITGLDARRWLPYLDDGTAELRLAAALASQHDGDGGGLRRMLAPVEPSGGRWRWRQDATAPVRGVEVRDLFEVLAEALWRRGIQTQQRRHRADTDAPGGEDAGGQEAHAPSAIAFRYGHSACLGDVLALLEGSVGVERVRSLLRALVRLDWRGRVSRPSRSQRHRGWRPPALAVLAPFFHARPIPVDWLDRPDAQPVELTPEAPWPAQLLAGRTDLAVAGALRRLRMAQLSPVGLKPVPVARCAPPAPRLAASLLIRLDDGAVRSLLREVCPPEPEEDATTPGEETEPGTEIATGHA